MASSDDQEEFKIICQHMGLALAAWQSVEAVHFRLFKNFLGTTRGKVASIAYHGIESFHARRVMVDRMALVCLGSKEARAEWSELNKHLKDANENRNKIAHYSVEFEMLSAETRDGITHLEIGSPKLRPAYENVVSKLIGRTPDKEEHNLDAEAIKQCVVQFKLLEGRLMAFLMDRQPRFRI